MILLSPDRSHLLLPGLTCLTFLLSCSTASIRIKDNLFETISKDSFRMFQPLTIRLKIGTPHTITKYFIRVTRKLSVPVKLIKLIRNYVMVAQSLLFEKGCKNERGITVISRQNASFVI